jgi:hypothetical protein
MRHRGVKSAKIAHSVDQSRIPAKTTLGESRHARECGRSAFGERSCVRSRRIPLKMSACERGDYGRSFGRSRLAVSHETDLRPVRQELCELSEVLGCCCEDLERRVLTGLKDGTMAPQIFEEAMQVYAQETNRLNRKRHSNGDVWRSELSKRESAYRIAGRPLRGAAEHAPGCVGRLRNCPALTRQHFPA